MGENPLRQMWRKLSFPLASAGLVKRVRNKPKRSGAGDFILN